MGNKGLRILQGVAAVAAASDAVAIVCGEDAATADRYEARNDALRSIARRRDLREDDVAALMAYRPLVHDGPGDAFRHCVWSCMMSRRCGSACALIATSYHELGIEDWEWNYEGAASNMDLYNNMIGLGVASGGSTCESGCLDRLYSGQLSIINKRALPSRDVVEDCIKQKQK